VKRSMVDRASRSVLLVDSSKFGQKHLEIVCPLARLSALVTDAAPTGALAQAVAAAGIALTVAS